MSVSGSNLWFLEAPPCSIAAVVNAASMVIDAADEKAAFIFQAPITGSIDRVLFSTRTVTTGCDVDVRLETVDATTGAPTGTLWGTNTNATKTIANSDDNLQIEVTLTAAASVTAGDILALVVVNPSSSFGNMQILQCAGDWRNQTFPYTALYTGSWSKAPTGSIQDSPAIAMRYTDTVWYGVCPTTVTVQTTTTDSFASNSNPDEIGLKFKFPWPVCVRGFWAHGDWDTANCTIKLYDSDGSTVLRSLAIDKDQQVSDIPRDKWYTFSSTVNLLKDTFYRLTLVPDTTTAVSLAGFTVGSAAYMDANPGGQNFHKTQRTDAGAWTDTTTARPFMGLVLSGFDDGTGGSAGMLYRTGGG